MLFRSKGSYDDDAVSEVSEVFEVRWDGAVALLPEMPVWGLVAVTLGGLWLCLWTARWRLAGVPLIAVGLASVALHRGPDILVSADARLVAVRGADGLLQLSEARASRLTRESWLRRAGQEDATTWPQAGASADEKRASPVVHVPR